jgi:hypothetical protein
MVIFKSSPVTCIVRAAKQQKSGALGSYCSLSFDYPAFTYVMHQIRWQRIKRGERLKQPMVDVISPRSVFFVKSKIDRYQISTLLMLSQL